MDLYLIVVNDWTLTGLVIADTFMLLLLLPLAQFLSSGDWKWKSLC